MDKEKIYDDQIAPLMAKIIEVCKANHIAHVCSFCIGEDWFCSTLNISEETDPPDVYKEMVELLYPPKSVASFMAFAIRKETP